MSRIYGEKKLSDLEFRILGTALESDWRGFVLVVAIDRIGGKTSVGGVWRLTGVLRGLGSWFVLLCFW